MCVEEAPKVKLKNPAELRAADIDMGYVLYTSLLAALNMAAVTSMVQNELSIAKKRRECSGPAPTHATETRAQACLGKLGMMQGLLECCLLYFLLAHSPEGIGPELMMARMVMRCINRPQALGMSGIGVDLDLGLRSIIEAKFGVPLKVLFQTFVEDFEGGDADIWSEEQARA